MSAVPQTRFSSAEFLAWCETLEGGRFELENGAVIAMSPETNRHGLVKKRVLDALTEAVAGLDGDCTVFPDGAGIVIDETTVREPDASIQCGPVDLDSLVLDNPVIVVEVLSPSSIRRDSIAKVDEYFRVPSIAHYLVVDPYNRIVIHHARTGSAIERAVHDAGTLSLSPPGIRVPVEALVGNLD